MSKQLEINYEEVMQLAIRQAENTMSNNMGGPFGAAIVKDGEVIAVASNSVLIDHDPTAHAEINAIRSACKKLGTHDLSGCELITTSEPCPMCLSAIIWANIKKVYYGCTAADAEAIGFRDDQIYVFIENMRKDEQVLAFEQISRSECLNLFNKYSEDNRALY